MNDITGRHFDVGIAEMRLPASIEREFARGARRVLACAPPYPDSPVPKRSRPPRREASLPRLLGCAEADFVDLVYADLLGRAPDRGGFAYYRSFPAEGRGARLAIIAAIRWSGEGRREAARLVGLRPHHVAMLLIHCARFAWSPVSQAGEACT